MKYKVNDYPKIFVRNFNFLSSEYGFSMKEEETDFSFINDFYKEDLRIHFNYDIRDNFFYFTFIRGLNTEFPNDKDTENIKPIFLLFLKNEPNIETKKLQPDNKQYAVSLELNAKLLKKYGDKILRRIEWI